MGGVSTSSEDAAREIARFAATTAFDNLPGEVVETVKRIVLDTVGTALAGSKLGAGCPELVNILLEGNGAPQSTLIGYGRRIPTLAAALANGATAHALNFDDTSPYHLGVVSFPAAFACAEYSRARSGKDLIVAVAIGSEFMARVGDSLSQAEAGYTESRPQQTQMPGYFAAALSAAVILGLNQDEIHSALSIALMQAGGGRQNLLDGQPPKAIYAGFSNHGGVLSALLTLKGLTAPGTRVFEGEAGFFKTYYQGRYSRHALVEGLGSNFRLLDIGFKPWPTTGVAHPFIEAGLSFREEHNLAAPSIKSVHLRGGERLKTFCEPLHQRRRPKTTIDAEDSAPFPVAKALVHGRISLADFQPGGLDDADVLELADRIDYSVDPALGMSGVLEVTTVEGSRYVRRVDAPLGHPQNPMSYEQSVAKFRDCAAQSATPLSDEQVQSIVDAITQMEDIEDIELFTKLLSE